MKTGPSSRLPSSLELAPGLLGSLVQEQPLWLFGTCGDLEPLIRDAQARAEAGRGPWNLVASMAFWDWQFNPLDRTLVDRLLVLDHHVSFLAPALNPLLGELSRVLSAPAQAQPLEALWAGDRVDDALELIARLAADGHGGLACLGAQWPRLLTRCPGDRLAGIIDAHPWPDTLKPVRAALLAQAAFSRRDFDPEAFLEAADPCMFGWLRSCLHAGWLLRQGEEKEAKEAFTALFRQVPWHLSLALTAAGLHQGEYSRSRLEASDTLVCSYTWGKPEALDTALEALAASELGNARVRVLDNGSDQDTRAVLKRAQSRFPEGCFSHFSLPVNIGAPSARNWLLALPEARQARWIAFLDDDVLVPPHWLERLHATARTFAHRLGAVGAVGCRLTDAGPPWANQCTETNLLPPWMGRPSFDQLPENIHPLDAGAATSDLGLTTYSRPCASVSGGCHLVSRQALDEAGGFDIAFTPSQFDDLDRDLRSLLAGYPQVFDGTLGVPHLGRSGLARAAHRHQVAGVYAHKLKLESRFAAEDIARAVEIVQDLQTAHLQRALALLDIPA
jgi:GT2 family glycosyltransferase